MGKNDHKFDESWMFSKIKLIFVIMYNNIMCKYNVVVNSGIERMVFSVLTLERKFYF